jgi:streptogramin lyase
MGDAYLMEHAAFAALAREISGQGGSLPMPQASTAKKILTLPLAVGAGLTMLISGTGPLTAHAATHVVQTGLGTIQEFPVPTLASTPNGIAAGSDGNLWFTEYTTNKIGRITPAGVITEFNVPTKNSAPRQIAAGPDGNLWFTEFSANQIGKITPAGVITEYAVPTANSGPRGIVAGPDGNIWFTEFNSGKIGKITTSGVVTEYTIATVDSGPRGIEPGPDGNLWFTENTGSKIGKITTSGVITEYTTGLTANSQPARIRIGPNGNLWFTENIGNKIGEINPTTDAITEFTIPTGASAPVGITPSADGTLWFTENGGDNIGDITTSGAITEYPVPTTGAGPQDIVAGPNGNIWFTEQTGNQIGEITPGPAKMVLSLDSGFVPSALTAVAPGTSLEWLFVGAKSHGVTDATKLKLFVSGAHNAGTSFSFVYSGAGVFKYKDSVQTTLSGSVSVAVSVSPTTGVHGNPFTVTFGTATAPAGYVFDLQVKGPKGGYVTIENGVTTGSAQYTPAAKGKYSFHARLRKSGSTTLASPYSAVTTLTVT